MFTVYSFLAFLPSTQDTTRIGRASFVQENVLDKKLVVIPSPASAQRVKKGSS